ncbi:alternative ribosome rescue aminoacyl-tRNA hydrolase ArfB [Bacteriovorax sp. Seq25_V]|uniref:alternative ribosome rescue aminoacyl-tRNA hydrolase ArfB n=1 Tax=Bacteriovorax sp. Seq25_V TaxID=1201288 RepID=UPI00038A1B80|nr:alternative ribosome rescue aminoacyl-tRNA hydrolase ArfB [Bacteriovorax sp. Seq25_V]EQC47476.1 RF-1 domain protein [Bacteriovorax sp. Seq25_V]
MIKIPYNEFTFSFSRSSGAGGQNVNKVNTKATLSWNMQNSDSCSEAVKKRFTDKYKRFIAGGLVVISSQKYRSQSRNVDDCIEKLHDYINEVRLPPKARRETKPTKTSVKKRLDSKSIRSKIKKLRNEKF